jgi:uncharacterized protein DUF1217
MSGIVSGMNYNLLFSPPASTTSGADLLTTLFSGSSSSAPPTAFISSGNPIADLALAQQETDTGVAAEAKEPQIAADVRNFTAAIAKAPDIKTALADPAVQKVLLTANGLSSFIGQTALVQKLLLSDPSDPTSLVNKFGNSTWLSTAQTYNLAKNGLSELKDPKVTSALTNGYAEVMWRKGLDQATPGLSNALTFLGQASSITSVLDVLSNNTNFEVITAALGLPQSIVFLDEAGQENAINSHLDISKLQDRHYVTSLTDQYLVTMQANKASSTPNQGSILDGLAVKAASLVV